MNYIKTTIFISGIFFMIVQSALGQYAFKGFKTTPTNIKTYKILNRA